MGYSPRGCEESDTTEHMRVFPRIIQVGELLIINLQSLHFLN